jgi:hypothetical protein
MSFTFKIATRKTVSVMQVWTRVGCKDLRCLDNLADGPWPVGVSHWFRGRVSSRTTEIERTKNRYTVRIFSMGTLEDWQLGVAFAGAFAEAAGVRGRSEDVEPGEPALTAEELRARHDETWAREWARSGPRVALYIAEKDKTEVSFGGVKRPIQIGARTLAAMKGEPDPEAALLELHRNLQWLELGTDGEILDVTNPAGVKGSISALSEDGTHLLPRAEYVAIAVDPDDLVIVPWSALCDLLGASARWWGDAWIQPPKFDADEWAALADRAQRFRVYTFG